MPKPKLSVALATFNESDNLDRCLRAIQSLTNQIIIVDGSSTDNTRDIARTYQAKVIKTTNPTNFHINKQKAITACTGDWILLLDADEVVTPKLAKEIKTTISLSEFELHHRRFDPHKQKLFSRHQALLKQRDDPFSANSQETVAFYIPRLNMFLGKPLRYGGVYPDGVIRLIKKNKARLPAKDVHEQFQVEGKVSWLQNDLLHYDSPTFSRYLQKANRYTTFTAQQLKHQNLPINFSTTINYLIIKPTLTFLKLYFRHKGFLDRFPGFIWCLFSALHYPIAFMKYWELTKKVDKLIS